MSKTFWKNISMILLLFLASVQLVFGQKTVLNLQQIQNEVQKQYPLAKGKELLQNQSGLTISNIKTNYLPRLYANGKMSYQSDVTGLGSLHAPKDQYSLNLDVEQLIYNGGKIKSQIKLSELSNNVDLQDLNVKLFALRERVNDAYFSILLLRKSKSILDDKKKTLNASLGQIQSAVESGEMIAANLQVLQAEVLRINQQMSELQSAETAAMGTLAELMNRNADFEIENLDAELDEVHPTWSASDLSERPEYHLYASQKSLLDQKIELEKKERLPMLTGFGQLGYGQPGYNQLNSSFDTYYMLGAKLSWNIFDWKNSKRNQQILRIQKDLIETQEFGFRKNQRVELRQELSNIDKFKRLIEQDDAIVDLQEAVRKSSASQLANGVITSSDYLKDLNSEIQAKLNRDYHRIQLSQALAEYKRIIGKTE